MGRALYEEWAKAQRGLHRRIEGLGVLALRWSSVREDEQVLVAVVRRLQRCAGLDVDEPAGGHVVSLRRLAHVHRQRLCEDHERLLPGDVPVAPTARARL